MSDGVAVCPVTPITLSLQPRPLAFAARPAFPRRDPNCARTTQSDSQTWTSHTRRCNCRVVADARRLLFSERTLKGLARRSSASS